MVYIAVLGELGEAANIAKKLNRVRDGIPGNKETVDTLKNKLRQEIGDAGVYLDLLAQSAGFNFGAAMIEVFNAKSTELGCPIRMESSGGLAAGSARLPDVCRAERCKCGHFECVHNSVMFRAVYTCNDCDCLSFEKAAALSVDPSPSEKP